MVKRLVIAGCRKFNDYQVLKEYVDFCISKVQKEYQIVVLSGGCAGADIMGERYALERGLAVERYSADWKKYGRAAGPIRNEKMAQKADYVICFWDGKSKGTASMIRYAQKYNKPLKIFKI